MSIHSPPLLLELAGCSLLSDKSRADLDLEDLPIELFPPFFVETFSRGHTEVVKKMVQAWPLTCLPLGALMRKPQLEMLQVALDGLDMLLVQQDRPRRWKLQVLDLQNVCYNFWRMWSGAVLDVCSPETMKKNGMLNHDQEPEKLQVCKFRVPPHTSPEEHEWLLTQLTSQLLRMDCLQKFCVDAVLLLESHLEQVLGSRTPLKTLSLRDCLLKEKDLKHLSLCPSTDQLKCLDLSSFSMKDMSPEPLWVLLEKVAHTLETLVLEFCEITESQLDAISPALGHCSQLKTFSFCGNQIPLTALKNLLSHTTSLPLEQVKYPAPLESFDEILRDFWAEINPMKFDQVQKELMQLVKDIRPVLDIQIYSYDCVLHLKHTDFIA
ncbi:PRAME family member 5-like [Marmota flaviventris]|uniref:PRAME family member 5-like n=1 Tax=Marmota flaviventris TaxID=93162 RepID=UPI003A8C3F59